jgi:hypothetical protein
LLGFASSSERRTIVVANDAICDPRPKVPPPTAMYSRRKATAAFCAPAISSHAEPYFCFHSGFFSTIARMRCSSARFASKTAGSRRPPRRPT